MIYFVSVKRENNPEIWFQIGKESFECALKMEPKYLLKEKLQAN